MSIVPEDYISRLNTIADALQTIQNTVGTAGHARPEEMRVLQKIQSELQSYVNNPAMIGHERKVAESLLEATNDLIAFDVEERSFGLYEQDGEAESQPMSSETPPEEEPKNYQTPYGLYQYVPSSTMYQVEKDDKRKVKAYICTDCNGTGFIAVRGSGSEWEGKMDYCEICNGSGHILKGAKGQWWQTPSHCPECGTKMIMDKATMMMACPNCGFDEMHEIGREHVTFPPDVGVGIKPEEKSVINPKATGFYEVSCVFCPEKFQDELSEVAAFKAREHAAEVHMNDPIFETVKSEIEGRCPIHQKDFKAHAPVEILEDVAVAQESAGGYTDMYSSPIIHTEVGYECPRCGGQMDDTYNDYSLVYQCRNCGYKDYDVGKTEEDRQIACPKCGGSGVQPEAGCSMCYGTGHVSVGPYYKGEQGWDAAENKMKILNKLDYAADLAMKAVQEGEITPEEGDELLELSTQAKNATLDNDFKTVSSLATMIEKKIVEKHPELGKDEQRQLDYFSGESAKCPVHNKPFNMHDEREKAQDAEALGIKHEASHKHPCPECGQEKVATNEAGTDYECHNKDCSMMRIGEAEECPKCARAFLKREALKKKKVTTQGT